MNHVHRAIFFGRLNASRLYAEKIASDASSTKDVLAEQGVVLAKFEAAALSGIAGQRIDQWVAAQLSGPHMIELPENILDICSRCSASRQAKGDDPHICDGLNHQKDQLALEQGGFCIGILYDAFEISKRIAQKWYADVPYVNDRRVYFRPLAQIIQERGSRFISELPHHFADVPSIVPANATTARPFRKGDPFLVTLAICVDRIEIVSICQLIVILHHEIFCHAFQYYESPDDWVDENDVFAEGFMNTAAFHALQLSKSEIRSEELVSLGCRDHADFCNRGSAFFEARDTSIGGMFSRMGREAFWDLKALCAELDPLNPEDIATWISVLLNSCKLSPEEKLNLLCYLRLLNTKSLELGDDARQVLVEALSELIEQRNVPHFIEHLGRIAAAWSRNQA